MIRVDEFRTGQFSLPAIDADEVPPVCFTCIYLFAKEFSVSSGGDHFYYSCSYCWPDKINQTVPPCLTADPTSASML